jgi:hypothetical protein
MWHLLLFVLAFISNHPEVEPEVVHAPITFQEVPA